MTNEQINAVLEAARKVVELVKHYEGLLVAHRIGSHEKADKHIDGVRECRNAIDALWAAVEKVTPEEDKKTDDSKA